ncbi:MAG: PEP-CTERM/exosortase system-associated acyltransferase [Desulfuromonadales bacterium]|nr:PEP-CTERM/exosortase system-associated acyltransferase [Desulfuromonadales bacterium]
MDSFQYQKIELSDAQIEEIYRLRFKVYCLECGYENACDYLNQLEMDEFDPVSTHFSACETHTGKVVGTARIILPSKLGFPALNHFTIDRNLVPDISPELVGEISRLAISKEYRQRMVDKAIYGNNVISLLDEKEKRDWRKRFEIELVTGLYHCIYAEGIELGLTHLYAVMSQGLYALLQRWGLTWKPIGPPLDYHGIRRPYVASIEENMHWFESEEKKISLC